MKKVAVILLLLMVVFTGCGKEAPAAEEGGGEAQTAVTAEDIRDYTLEEYLRIETGAAYEDICGLLGDAGEEMAGGDRLKQYIWSNEDDTNISVTFCDNEVTAKSQYGLGPFLSGSKKVTRTQYEKLKEGLSLKEVTDILGPGTEMMSATSEGQETSMYVWQNDDGGMISVTLEGDQVTKISGMMLE